MRVMIVGQPGSGKSWLARQVAGPKLRHLAGRGAVVDFLHGLGK
ncbi:hypothetical protein [Stagnihabitans tardus]|nr:hypothetical protein [Stagnihabitans tardus]